VVNAAEDETLFAWPKASYTDFIIDKWSKVCTAIRGIAGDVPGVQRVLSEHLAPWGDRQIGETADYPSFVSADGFPAELSVSWRDGEPEVRVLFEPLAEEATPLAVQEAGRALTRSLAERPGVSVDRYLLLEDLFVVDEPRANRPGVWLSLAWRPGCEPRYKVYLNPQARGAEHAWDVVEEAMGRLGLGEAWRSVALARDRLVQAGHELEFFALDLSDDARARVKVYFRHHDATIADVNDVASFARQHDPVRTALACQTVYGVAGGVLTNEPMTCLTFRQGAPRAEEANVYFRLTRNARSDADARERISTVLSREGVDPSQYRTMVDRLAPRPPDRMRGLHELVSYRTHAGRPADVGVYFRFPVHQGTPGRA
jgi:DMATS type aromatic prenyltransferase